MMFPLKVKNIESVHIGKFLGIWIQFYEDIVAKVRLHNNVIYIALIILYIHIFPYVFLLFKWIIDRCDQFKKH